MEESSGAATRALLGWLEGLGGSDADFCTELEALKHQIQQVEEDECRGSDWLSNGTSPPDHNAIPLHANVGPEYIDTEPIDWNGNGETSDKIGLFGWCGLDAISSGLTELHIPTISQEEAVRILSTTTAEIIRNGTSVNQLEALVNTRQ